MKTRKALFNLAAALIKAVLRSRFNPEQRAEMYTYSHQFLDEVAALIDEALKAEPVEATQTPAK